jgi:hypothetical protein
MGDRSIYRSVDLGMMSTTGFQSPPDKAQTVEIHRTQFQTRHPKSTLKYLMGDNIK